MDGREAAQQAVDSDLSLELDLGKARRVESCATAGNSQSLRRDTTALAVLKFGGSSLAGAERLLRAGSIVQEVAAEQQVAVVVSALRGITDQLYGLARHLCNGARGLAISEAECIVNLHRGVARDLNLDTEDGALLSTQIDLLGRELLAEVSHKYSDSAAPETVDRIVSFGERFSCRLMAATLGKLGTDAMAVEATEFLVTSAEFQSARPQLELTAARASEIFPELFEKGIVPVVTGFLGATLDGRITTLGRNSSDYSAAIVAHALGASELVIWTDVDGMYTANPHQSKSARLLSELSYTSAQALAASGAKVLHHDVIPLAAKTQMTVAIRNSLNLQARGTIIGPFAEVAQ